MVKRSCERFRPGAHLSVEEGIFQDQLGMSLSRSSQTGKICRGALDNLRIEENAVFSHFENF